MKFTIRLVKQLAASAILILHYHKEYRVNDFKHGTGIVEKHPVLLWAVCEFWAGQPASPVLWNSTENFLSGMME